MNFTQMATISRTAERAKAEGLGISEMALRRWVKSGQLPAVYAGNRALIFWPTLISFLGGGGNDA